MADVKGYMTVEASFIIPWVIFIFIFIIYSAYFLYDRCVIFQDSYAYAVRAANKQMSGTDVERYMNDNAAAQYGNKYIAVSGIKESFKVSEKEIAIEAAGQPKCQFIPNAVLPDIRGWKASADVKASRENPTQFMRICRGAAELTKGKR